LTAPKNAASKAFTQRKYAAWQSAIQTAAVTISRIELAAKIRKQQFKVGKLPGRPTTIPAIWAAVVGA
jgi:hypothetical protein